MKIEQKRSNFIKRIIIGKASMVQDDAIIKKK